MTEHELPENPDGSANELKGLLSRLAQNDIDQAGIARLCVLLSESEEARWAYLHSVHLSEGIKRWSRVQGESDIWAVVNRLRQSDDIQDEELADELEKLALQDALTSGESLIAHSAQLAQGRLETTKSDLAHRSRPWQRKAALVTAVALLFAVSLWRVSPLLEKKPINAALDQTGKNSPVRNVVYAFSDSEHVVARVTSTTGNVLWLQGREPQDFLMRFRPGDVFGTEQGLIQLEFTSGALLIVESPAVMQVTSANSARLIQGRIVGKADNGNFTLLTPTASVVDIGTEFGVGVSDVGTDVTVFEGEVHVHPLLGKISTESIQKLQSGMTVRIDSQGQSALGEQADQQFFHRSFDRSPSETLDLNLISLLDLISGHDSTQQRIAGSIDPKTGYWGRPPWLDPQRKKAQRGDTQFAQTDWNPMVDGVFIPRSNAREMQIDSDGHMVYLPPNNGSTWGPIWARRRIDLASEKTFLSTSEQDQWGAGALSKVLERLQKTRDGLMGLHANVGITFDLDAVRESRSRELQYFKADVANLDGSQRDDVATVAGSVADLRIFVDGKLRYSRLQFGREDGEAPIHVALSNEDRFLTIVTTDAGSDPVFDHVVLIDPLLECTPPPAAQPDQA